VHFIPVDRINVLIAVAPNPGIFTEVEKWIGKLDIPIQVTAGSTSNWVYRLKYGRAETVAMAIMALYTGNPSALIQLAAQANSSMYSAGLGLNVTGTSSGYGMGGVNGGYGNMGGAYGGNMYGGMGGNMNGGYGGMYGGYQQQATPILRSGAGAPMSPSSSSSDRTGTYLGDASAQGGEQCPRMPHVIPNPFDNTILVQGTPQDWEQIQNLLHQLDVPPRQVLIDCKIYEVDLNSSFAAGLASCLQSPGGSACSASNNSVTGSSNSSQSIIGGLVASLLPNAAAGPGGLALSAGMVVGKSKQLMGLLTASETSGRTKVIASPSIIATDSVAATMNVGDQVPVATSTGLAATTVSGTSQTYQSISNQTTGVTLSITPRINSSGVVTMQITQQVSAPSASASNSLGQGFSNRSMSTQITVQDGDTVAIGGAITETKTEGVSGVPLLDRIPLIGGTLFGSKTTSVARSELIIFLTPHVIYDTNQMLDATDEIKSDLKHVGKLIRDDHQ